MSMLRKAVLVGGLVVIVDQTSKTMASVPFLREEVQFVVPIVNPGLTLGVADAGRWTEVLLMMVVLLAGTGLMARLHRRGLVGAWSVGLVLGGAVGNILDRAFFGSVRDFLALGPVIVNFADLAVLFGMVVLYAGFLRRTDLGMDQVRPLET